MAGLPRLTDRVRARLRARRDASPWPGAEEGADPLTGLPTAQELRRRFAEEARPAAVVLVDLDGIKELNDRHGHALGDEVLAAVAARLAGVAPGATVARVGGDEFAVAAWGVEDEAALEWIVAEVERAAAGLLVTAAGPVEFRGTAGGSIWKPGEEATAALSRADERMMVAKALRADGAFGRLADLVAHVLHRAPGEELLEAAAGALALHTSADLGLLLVDGRVGFQPDLAPRALRAIAELAAREAQATGTLALASGDGAEALAVPLDHASTEPGALSVARAASRFGRRERIALAQAARLLGPALSARIRLEGALASADRLRQQALRDETTGLPNRRALVAALESAIRQEDRLAVLLADFDGLRAVNNALGPEAGDELIRRVGTAIAESLGEGELAARLHGSGGDEFVVLLPGSDARYAALRAQLLEAHLDALPLPDALAGLYGGASVGYAVWDGVEEAIEFLERAAAVMRDRKRARKQAAAAQPRG